MTTAYDRAPEVEQIARTLIRDVEQHKNLDHARIEFVWRDKASKSKGRVVFARARKVGGLNAFLVNAAAGEVDANDPLFVVEVAADTWERLTEKQRVALVDHELCHLTLDFDDDGLAVLGTRGHDLEEFSCIVHRHGLWKSDVATFDAEVAEQLAFAIEEAGLFLDDLGSPSDGDEGDGQ